MDTGRGKEQIMKVATKCAATLESRYPEEKSTLMSTATSLGAMITEMEHCPRKGVVIDEIGHWLEASSAKTTNPALKDIISFFMQIAARADGEYIPPKYSKMSLSKKDREEAIKEDTICLLYTSPSPRDRG